MWYSTCNSNSTDLSSLVGVLGWPLIFVLHKKNPVNFLKLSESTMMKLCPNKSQQESIVFLYSNSESLYTRGSTLFINELIELN